MNRRLYFLLLIFAVFFLWVSQRAGKIKQSSESQKIADSLPAEANGSYQPPMRKILIPRLDEKIGEQKSSISNLNQWREANEHWEKIAYLSACLKKDSCENHLARQGPREQHFHARDQLLLQLNWFLGQTIPSKQIESQAVRAALELVDFPDEQVQEKALDWLSRMPPQRESVRKIRESVEDAVDPVLIRLAVRELRRHLGGALESEVLGFAENVLFTGGAFASREMAQSARLLIHDGNRHIFQRWLTELPPGSLKSQLLSKSIAMSQSSGF